jgi:hypothetical protein
MSILINSKTGWSCAVPHGLQFIIHTIEMHTTVLPSHSKYAVFPHHGVDNVFSLLCHTAHYRKRTLQKGQIKLAKIH